MRRARAREIMIRTAAGQFPQGAEWHVIYSNTLRNTAPTICYNYTMINGTMLNTTPKYMQITHTSHTVHTPVQRTTCSGVFLRPMSTSPALEAACSLYPKGS